MNAANHPVYSRLRLRLAGLLACAALLGACASQPGASDAQTQRLGQLFQAALPIAEMMEGVAARYPRWPLEGVAPGRYTPADLACVRYAMRSDLIRQRQQADALRYAQTRSPAQLTADIDLLERAAPGLGGLMRAGANAQLQDPTALPSARQEGARAAARQAMADVTPQNGQAMLILLLDPAHQPLRQAMHIEGLATSVLQGRRASSLQGKALGAGFVIEPLFQALEQCQLPLSVLEPH